MNPLRAYVDEHGAEAVAAELNAAFPGRKYTARRVETNAAKDMPPKTWVDALGLDEPSSSATLGGPRAPTETEPDAEQTSPPSDPEARQSETPPKAPPGTIVQKPPMPLTVQAKERIAALHVFAGASIATATDAEGFEHDRGVGGGIAKLWTDKSEPIAEAWIAWAEEGNKFAQAFVRMMGTGGAGGNLALGYASLLGGTAYILGHMPDNEATRVVYGRYSRYRTVTPTPASPSDRARDNGAGEASAADSVGETAHPFGL